MRKLQKTLCPFVMSILLAACGGNPPKPPPLPIPPAFMVCAQFTAAPYADNYHPGTSFIENGFTFADPTGFQFTNLIGSGVPLGLQFPNTGIKITLPLPASIVTLDMGGFAGGINFGALSSTGVPGTTGVLAGDNSIHTVLLHAVPLSDIKTVSLKDGNNEGIVIKICAQ